MTGEPAGLRGIGRSALAPVDRRFELVHRHLDEIAQRLEHDTNVAELRQLLADTLAELRAQSAATLELARTLETFAEAMAIRFEAIAGSIERERERDAAGPDT